MSKKMMTATTGVTGIAPNSPKAFGARMQDRLNTLLAKPYQFLPSYADRYTAMLEYAQKLSPQQAYAMTMLFGKDVAAYYPDMPNTADLRFPTVDGWQPQAQMGWYYYAGHCTGKDGKMYGVLFMIFGYSLVPPKTMEKFGLTDLQNQIADMQFAVTVEGGNFYQADPVVTAGTSGRIRYETGRLHYESESCSAISKEPGKLFPLQIRAKGVDRSSNTELEIDFAFASAENYLPQGFDGACPLVAGVGTRYYSVPGIRLDAAASRLKIGGKDIELESGTFWMDHQWGLGMLPAAAPRFLVMQAAANVSPAGGAGWDFFALNMDDGSALTLSSLHTAESAKFANQTGPDPPGTMTLQVAGKYVDRLGVIFNASGTITVKEWAKTESTPNPEKYVNTPTWVPHGADFQLLEGVLPENLRELKIEHISTSAQCLWYGAGLRYVEAAVRVLGADGTRVGAGYQEAVGYLNTLTTILSLAGMPVTPEILALFQPEPLPPALVWESLVYFLLNQEAFNTLMTAGSMPPAPRTSGDRVPDEPSSEPPGVIKRWMKDTTGITVPQPPAVRTFPAVP